MDSPSTPSKRRTQIPASVERNLARKRVRVDAVVPLPQHDDDEERVISHPSLLSLGDSVDAENLDAMSLRVVRRKVQGQAVDNDGELEMIANVAKREWHAQRGYNEMNLDYFIGVRNRKTDVLQLFQIDSMFSLRPFAYRKRNIDDEIDATEGEERQTYREQRAELLQTFGGRRSQLRMERYQRDRITDEKVDEKAQEQLNVAARDMITKDAREGIHYFQKATTEQMAPPHDNNATSPEGAYPLEGLMSSIELSALAQEAQSMIEVCADDTTLVENPGWHPLVWNVLIRLATENSQSSSVRLRRMQAAMHLHYLIELSKCPTRIRRRERVELMQRMAVDEGILDCLLSRFTVADSKYAAKARLKSQASELRITVYGILMWLTTNDFTNCGRLGELSKALRVSLSLILSHAAQLGCKVKRKQGPGAKNDPGGYRLSLPVPLKFPEIRRRLGRPAKRS